MTQRNTPCTECRKHRRKCIRDSIKEVCSRCRRLERKCITADIIDLDISDSENAESVIQQIKYLNSTITELEAQIKLLKSNNAEDDTNNNKSVIRYNGNEILANNWDLTIQNGELHIETGIKNISDLLLSCPSIQYLSPFPDSSEKGFVLQFGGRKKMCLRVLASKLLMKPLAPEKQQQVDRLSVLSLPTSLLFDARFMMDSLIQIYFDCHLTFHPLIHQPSFMQYYKQLEQPLDSLICLSICCYVCSAPCQCTLDKFGDLADIGKYFNGLAKMKLLEQFDIKEKRLENMVSANILVSYFNSSLLNNECKKILTIAYQIAIDLLPWYEKKLEKKEPLSIECVIFSRNVALPLMGYQRSIEMEGKPSLYKVACLPWHATSDEPVDIIDYVDAQNRLTGLYNHPIMLKLKDQTRELMRGGECTLPFDLIIGLDEAVTEWRNHLPERYRICHDWLNVNQCRNSIEQCTDGLALISFVNFLVFMLGVYSQMLQPKYVPDNNILSIVEKMTLDRALYCCQMVLCGFNRVKSLGVHSPCKYIIAMKRHLFHIADVLILLSSSSNDIVKNEAQSVFQSCIAAIESVAFTNQIEVDPSKSPLLSKGYIPPKDLVDINLSAYSKYSQPWYALMYDMCRYLHSNNALHNTFE